MAIVHILKGNVRNIQKLKVFDKLLHYTKKFSLKNPFFTFSANFIFRCFTCKKTLSCSFKQRLFKK